MKLEAAKLNGCDFYSIINPTVGVDREATFESNSILKQDENLDAKSQSIDDSKIGKQLDSILED